MGAFVDSDPLEYHEVFPVDITFSRVILEFQLLLPTRYIET